MEWHGFPNEELDRVVGKILAGTFNLERAQRKEAGDRLVDQYTALVSKPNAAAKAAPLGDRILADFSPDCRVPHHLAKAVLHDPALRSRGCPLALRATAKAVEFTDWPSSDAAGLSGRVVVARG